MANGIDIGANESGLTVTGNPLLVDITSTGNSVIGGVQQDNVDNDTVTVGNGLHLIVLDSEYGNVGDSTNGGNTLNVGTGSNLIALDSDQGVISNNQITLAGGGIEVLSMTALSGLAFSSLNGSIFGNNITVTNQADVLASFHVTNLLVGNTITVTNDNLSVNYVADAGEIVSNSIFSNGSSSIFASFQADNAVGNVMSPTPGEVLFNNIFQNGSGDVDVTAQANYQLNYFTINDPTGNGNAYINLALNNTYQIGSILTGNNITFQGNGNHTIVMSVTHDNFNSPIEDNVMVLGGNNNISISNPSGLESGDRITLSGSGNNVVNISAAQVSQDLIQLANGTNKVNIDAFTSFSGINITDGTGKDTLTFVHTSNTGMDTASISGFNVANDHLNLQGYGHAAHSITSDGSGGTLVTDGNAQIDLLGVSPTAAGLAHAITFA